MKPIELAVLHAQIAALRAAYPEIDEDESLLLGMLEGETPVFEILAAIVNDEREADSMVDATTSRMQTLLERRDRYIRKKAALRVMALRIMEAAGIRKAELAEATLSIRATPPAVVITDESELPESMFKVVRTPSKKAIGEALKAGEFVPGATLSNAGETLSVRTA